MARAGQDLPQLIGGARASCREYGGLDESAFAQLARQLRYVDGDYADEKTFAALKAELSGAQRPTHYLAIPPSMFATVIENLGKSGCAAGGRVVVEKPFGRDLRSARELNAIIHAVFAEDSVFRIDHYHVS